MLVTIIRSLMAFLFRVLTRTTVIGIENVPTAGGVILSPNHMSVLDPALVFVLMPRMKRADLTGLVAKKHQKNMFFRPLINAVHGIWLNREEADTRALRTAREHLQGGKSLGISPEGTRSNTQMLIRAKTGVAYMADKAGVPVLPIAITGTEDAWNRIFHFHRATILMKFGKPFQLPPIRRENRERDLLRNTDEIMCRIAAMLPPKYWGYYKDHPRLHELLASGYPENQDYANQTLFEREPTVEPTP